MFVNCIWGVFGVNRELNREKLLSISSEIFDFIREFKNIGR